MGDRSAWVTLATNDSYCLGALVLAHSLRRVATAHSLVILVTPQVTPVMKERLAQVFSDVVTVDVLDSGDAAHLALLARPELGITFTKLHCWNLTQYSKCVFLDADTLVLQNCDELFEREELSAAPDVGWPDCFNSGVFVYRPSTETFSSLLAFAKAKGSFDGGDQGLLNQFFSSWATQDISKHLPFVYNVCSTSFYSYLPALKQYGGNMKIIHFIGSLKPWLQNYNWGSRSVQESGHLQGPLQHWWDIFIDHVHPVLDVAMAGVAGTLSQLSIGVTEPSPVLEEHLRRQGWEAGNIDYMGADAFDNIWAKIAQTLSICPAAPTPVEVQAPAAPAPVQDAPAPIPQPIPEPTSAAVPAPVPVEQPKATPPPSEPVAPAPIQATLKSVSSDTSTDSWEKVTEVSLVAPSSGDDTSSGLESSTGSSASTISSATSQSGSEKGSATTEEKGENKRAEAEPSQPAVAAPPKLVCHLKPTFEVDQLLTPESEHEDAATIAQKIIASEEALSSPVITSPTSPAPTPVTPALPQNVKDLSVDTAIPDTPPVPALVSLAQIGILPSQVPLEAPKAPQQPPKAPLESPKSPLKLPKSPLESPKAPLESSKGPESPKTPESPKVPLGSPKAPLESPKIPLDSSKSPLESPKAPLESPKESPKTTKESPKPSTPETDTVVEPKPTVKLVKKKSLDSAGKTVKKSTKESKSPEEPSTPVEAKSMEPKISEAETPKLVCSIKTKGDSPKTVAQIVIPDDLQDIVKKTSLTKTDSSDKVAESKVKVEKKSEETAAKPKSTSVKKVAPEEPTPKVAEAKKEPLVKAEESEKKSEPSTPTEETPAKPKVKKVIKKVPATPKPKAEGDEASAGADMPVPPPRKKIVKPKEK